MKHIDLFSGIGGFAYAIDQIFYEEKNEHIFVENDKFCQAILKKHWPEAEVRGDIREFTANTGGKKQRGVSDKARKNISAPRECDIVTGGFPCQPFSHAGVRKGASEDDRYLWPEMFRIISEARPEWVIAENVDGLLSIQSGLVFEQVCSDMEKEGYEVRTFNIPACAVGAPHQRKRVWIVGHLTDAESREPGKQAKQERRENISRGNKNASDTESERDRGSAGKERGIQKRKLGAGKQKRSEVRNKSEGRFRGHWDRSWKEIAFTTCHDGVDDGLPRELDGAVISPARHRKERLKACGNAIVPQVAMKILEGIKIIRNEDRFK